MRFIICLGVVSLFADITYEGARSISGPFLKGLGATAAQVGFIAGFGEFIGYGLRLVSGTIADRTRSYWTITILGYIVNLFAVPLMAFAGNWPTAALLVAAERAAKGMRAPARDVLLSEAAQRVGRGWGFGLHAAMDQTGAVLGPLFVAWSVARANGYAPALLRLAIPAGCAIAALLVARLFDITGTSAAPANLTDQPLPRVFWIYVAAAGLLAAGYADFPIVAFHFEASGLMKPAVIPLMYTVAMAANGITAPLFGKLFDRFGLAVLSVGILFAMAALPLNFFGGMDAALFGVFCWGTGMGAMDAVLRSGVADLVSMNKRGRAFGLFNFVYGAMWLAGSSAMGFLYERSILALVILGLAAQLASAAIFFALRNRLRAP
ncbi:MAG TPA: MFS transporter [Bryobacteraceae bacterium]|jgi:MFS family permease